MEKLNFGQAIDLLKQGKRIARKNWNGKGLFVFMQVPSTISSNIIPNMQSLPKSVKDEFGKRFEAPTMDSTIKYSNQMAIVNPDNSINGWVPSASDVFAEDWVDLDAMESNIEPHKLRVINERDELNERASKLQEFILRNPIFKSLAQEEKDDLSAQFNYMSLYLEVLESRIKRF
jgi:hypothetical protein